MVNFSLPKVFPLIILLLINCKNEKSKKLESTIKKTTLTTNSIAQQKVILFYGNSITAGYGLELSEAFPALIAKRLDSLNLNIKCINAGLSGETSAGGIARLNWVLKQKIDVFVLELGANDGLRGIVPSETKKNLQKIMDIVKQKYPEVKIILAGMQMPPSMGTKFTEEFKQVFIQLASENKVSFIPFLLEGVAGDRTLNQPDGIHPTAPGHKIIAKHVWKVLQVIVGK